MEKSPRFYLLIMACAIGFGILGDGLLRVHPFGLNLAIWTTALLAAAALLSRSNKPFPKSTYWLMGVAALFGLTLAWRDSLALKCLSGFAAFTAFALAAQWARALRTRLVGVTAYGLAQIEGFLLLIQGAPVLAFRDCLRRNSEEEPSSGTKRRRWLFASMRGVLLALPLVLLFGGLFASADLAFRKIVFDLFDLEELARHIALTFLYAWLAAGVLKGLLDGASARVKLPGEVEKVRLGVIEASIVMTLLDLLFLSFVVVQFRYLFGGEDRVREIAGLTYAEYARGGFFELCAVATLVLGALLLGDWLLRDAERTGKRMFRILAGLQLLLLVAIMASAFQRMRMYQDAYGLTELRLYVTAFMIWLGVALAWLVLTVLRGRRETFAFGAYVAGLAAVLALHAINPDAYVVRANAARLSQSKSFDAEYAATLSADAVPALVDVLPKLDRMDRSRIAQRLQWKWLSPDTHDWRAWSWGRSSALRAVKDNGPLIEDSAAAVRFPPPERRAQESRE